MSEQTLIFEHVVKAFEDWLLAVLMASKKGITNELELTRTRRNLIEAVMTLAEELEQHPMAGDGGRN